MDKKIGAIIRGFLIFFGIACYGLVFYLVFSSVSQMLSNGYGGVFQVYSQINTVLLIFLLVFGLILYKIGRHWDNTFKALTKTLVGFALFFLMFALMLFPVNDNSHNIAYSVQPTIDYMGVGFIDDMVKDYLPVVSDDVEIVLSSNSEVEGLYVSNISQSQADFIVDELGVDFSGGDAISFVKIFITAIFNEIEKTNPSAHNVPIPISELKNIFSSQVDTDMIGLIDISLLEENLGIDGDAYLMLLLSNDTSIKSVNPSNLDVSDVDLIWENLGLVGDVSFEIKERLVAGILSFIIQETKGDVIGVPVSIPVSSLSYMIPVEIKDLIANGIFSTNISKRVYALNLARVECKSSSFSNFSAGSDVVDNDVLVGGVDVVDGGAIEVVDGDSSIVGSGVDVSDVGDSVDSSVVGEVHEKFCDAIGVIEYEHLINILSSSNLSEFSSVGIDLGESNFSEMFLDVGTIDGVEKYVWDYSSKWSKFVYIFIFLIVLSLIFYYLHFYLFKRELILVHVPYYISKLNLIAYLPSFVFLMIIYFVLKSRFLIDMVSTVIGGFGVTVFDSNFFMSLPIYRVILEINYDFFILALVYLFFSILVYGIFYFLLRKKVIG